MHKQSSQSLHPWILPVTFGTLALSYAALVALCIPPSACMHGYLVACLLVGLPGTPHYTQHLLVILSLNPLVMPDSTISTSVAAA